MGRTSIPCETDTRELLLQQKQSSETWDECLLRLAEGTPVESGDMDVGAVVEKLSEMERKMDEIDTRPTEGVVSVNEIRESVRIEVRNQITELLH